MNILIRLQQKIRQNQITDKKHVFSQKDAFFLLANQSRLPVFFQRPGKNHLCLYIKSFFKFFQICALLCPQTKKHKLAHLRVPIQLFLIDKPFLIGTVLYIPGNF